MAASAARKAEIAKLTASWKDSKTSKDWIGAKEIRATLDAAVAADEAAETEERVKAEGNLPVETRADIERARDALIQSNLHRSCLKYVEESYRRESDRKGEADKYDEAAFLNKAADAAAELATWAEEWFPDATNDVWGGLAEVAQIVSGV